MKHLKKVSYTLIITTLIIMSVNIFAKVGSIRNVKLFDDYTSAQHLITIVLAYTQPKKLEKTERRAIR